ncbi:MAG: hypothetical protein R3E12_03775 [Candidatus Eisenbacteria bacterium]
MTDQERNGAAAPHGLKRALFAVLTLALPVLLILGLELGLRAAGYGGYGHTFQATLTTPDGRTLMEAGNDRVDSFFLRNRDLPGHLDRRHFWNPKPANALRVIVVGESAIRGFPEPANLTATSFLEAMLHDALPDRPIDVINLGTTAIASYPILELGTEALDQDPDVMIVQAGNNEFFGAFGVASLNKAGNSPVAIAFQRWGRSLAIAQWAEALGAKLRKQPGAPTENMSETLMERMMGREYTAPDDPIRAAAARNIETHVHELIRRCEKRGVPVVVCVTGTNERGMAPLGESRLDEVPESDRPRLQALLQTDPDSAATRLGDLRWAVGVAPTHARAQWLLGMGLHESGSFEEARAAFQRAVDLDPMPWRGTSAIQAAVRKATDGTGAVFVDAQAALRAASDGGSVGWPLMDDHVHMSLEGQAVVGRALFEGLTRVPGLGLDSGAVARVAGNEAYAERLGRNIFDERGVAFRMFKLLEVPFFTATNPWASALMRARMQGYEAQMTDSEVQAMHAWEDPRASLDYGVPASAFAGQVCLAEERYEQGARAYRGAAQAIGPFTYLNLEFTSKWMYCEERVRGSLSPEEIAYARAAIERGQVMNSAPDESAPAIARYMGGLYKGIGDCDAAVPYLQRGRLGFRGTERERVDLELVECLIASGKRNEARRSSTRGLLTASRWVFEVLCRSPASARGVPHHLDS